MERDYALLFYHKYETNFNSHAHVERDEKINADVALEIDFNSHAHVERDPLTKCIAIWNKEFQLTRSRGA